MLTIYRRHREKCPHADDRVSKKCRCGLWFTGTLFGQPYRKSAKTRNWDAAEKFKRELEGGKDEQPAIEQVGMTLKQARDLFITDMEAQNRVPDTVRKYKLLFKQLSHLGANRPIADFSFDVLLKFRSDWSEKSPATRNKKLDRLKSFFGFCHDAGWILKNPTKRLKPAAIPRVRVQPFSSDEQAKILAKPQTARIRTFVHTLYHAGLRISDASFLRPADFNGNCIRCVNRKNQAEVYVPLPPYLKAELDSLPLTGGYYFLIGQSEHLGTQTDAWRTILNDLFKEDIPQFHPHRFRHTRVVEWLAGGLTLEEISGMIGTSAKILEKHYASFAPARQQVVSEKLNRLWNAKPRLVRVK